MFTPSPQWQPAEAEGHNVKTIIVSESSDGMECNDAAISSNYAPATDSGIELTHDLATGITSVSNEPAASNDYSGDIWTTDAFQFDSPLKDLLDSQNFTLRDLLGQDELLQELRGCHATLLEYFGRAEVVAGLVECLAGPAPQDKQLWLAAESKGPTPANEPKEAKETNETKETKEAEETTDIWGRRCAPILHATSDDTDADPHVEAYWDEPPQRPDNAKAPGDWLRPAAAETNATTRSPEEEYDLQFIRYPYMACEVICSQVGNTIDILVDGYVDRKHHDSSHAFDAAPLQNVDMGTSPASTQKQRILDVLFSLVIDTPTASLDDRRAGYFEKVLVVLFRKRSQAMSDYMNTSMVLTNKSIWALHHHLRQPDDIPLNEKSHERHADDNTCQPDTDDQHEQDGKEGNQDHIHNVDADHESIQPSTPENATPHSSYVSLSERAHSTDSIEDPTSPPNTPSTLFQCPTASDDARPPPMLMCALFDHLHSHSMMHILQRLLLPSPTRQNPNEENNNTNSASDVEGDNPNATLNSNFLSNLNQINEVENGNVEDDDEDDPMNHLFLSDWSERPGPALQLLMARLEGDTESFLQKYGYPVGYKDDCQNKFQADGTNGTISNELKETTLLCSQHASEILITLIQNSALDSPVMMALSSDPSLQRLLNAASLLDSTPLVAHESTMTCAVTVLESLILQLGGFGGVGTTANLTNNAANAENPINEDNGDNSNNNADNSVTNHFPTPPIDVTTTLTEIGPHTPVSSPKVMSATTSALLTHLPNLLPNLSSLLTHPAASMWSTPAQYAQQRPLLGMSRLRILRLIESLVLLSDPAVDQLLLDSGLLERSLDLFWQFEWCSMLHQSTANLLVHVFEGGDGRSDLQEYFIGRCRLLERLMESFDIPPESKGETMDECDQKEEETTQDTSPVNDDIPRYGDMMLAMKSLYQTDPTSSSLESEHGSESDGSRDSIDDAGVVVPVSDDDVDAAMEKERESKEADHDEAMVDILQGEGMSDTLDDSETVTDAITEIVTETATDTATDTEAATDIEGAKDTEVVGDTITEDVGDTITEVVGDTITEDVTDTITETVTDTITEDVAVVPESFTDVITETAAETSADGRDTAENSILTEANPERPAITFRKGYMGHVIIICQALVKACNKTSNTSEKEPSDSGDILSAEAEHAPCSKKRKDRPPSREEDATMKRGPTPEWDAKSEELFSPTSPISKTSSPTRLDTEQESFTPKPEQMSQLDSLMRRHPLYNKWQHFVTSTLTAEMAVQSVPLGGQQAVKEALAAADNPQASTPSLFEDAAAADFLRDPDFNAGAPNIAVGEIDMDEADLDIAASMMEALSLPPSSGHSGLDSEESLSNAGTTGHHRRGVIGGGGVLSAEANPFGSHGSSSERRGIANFGSVIKRPETMSAKEYVYDDPLGGAHPFDTGDIDAEGNIGGTPRHEGVFMSDAMVITSDSQQDGDNINKSSSMDSDGIVDDDDDDDDVRVIDLFAGNFSFEDNDCTVEGESGKDAFSSSTSNNEDVAWANFANFDDAFASSNMIEPTPIGLNLDSSNQFHDSNTPKSQISTDDFFSSLGKADNEEDAFASPTKNFDLADGLNDSVKPAENGDKFSNNNFSVSSGNIAQEDSSSVSNATSSPISVERW